MGRCNGGGGRNTGGGGFQEGQNKGTKSGKSGHGKNSGHDASQHSQREERKYDKQGQPLNYGPFRNGYYVADKKPTVAPQNVGIAADQVAALSLLADATKAASTKAALAKEFAAASKPAGGAGGASGSASGTSASSSKPVRPKATLTSGSMSPSQSKESERLMAVQAALDASASHGAMRTTRGSLPAAGSREELLRSIGQSPALVVCGETGCGKSTQVPQYLLEEAVANGRGAMCTVLIAQPRRVAAISLAERVAAERGESVGQSVGYSIRHEAVASGASTRLLFCTTGVILRRLQEDPRLHGVSHVVVDEAHERTSDGDFLLMVLRRLMRVRDDLRVVLMSATLDATLFSSCAPPLHTCPW